MRLRQTKWLFLNSKAVTACDGPKESPQFDPKSLERQPRLARKHSKSNALNHLESLQ